MTVGGGRWWATPAPGDIVWCRFRADLGTPSKPRPALVTRVLEDEERRPHVLVAYGTSQKVGQLFSGEFSITSSRHPQAYELAGLSYDTKFNLKNLVELPFDDAWFGVPPGAPHGQWPKLGTLHPSMMNAVRAAKAAVAPRR